MILLGRTGAKRRVREGECKRYGCSRKGTEEEKGIPPWKVTYLGERSNEPEESPDAEKSVAVRWSTERLIKNRTDHLNYGHSHQKLRRLGGGWAPRPRLQRLVPGKGLSGAGWSGDCLGGLETGLSSFTVQRLPGRLESRASWVRAGKWKATSEGTWEKSWICWREQCASVGEWREEGVGHHRILPTPQ